MGAERRSERKRREGGGAGVGGKENKSMSRPERKVADIVPNFRHPATRSEAT